MNDARPSEVAPQSAASVLEEVSRLITMVQSGAWEPRTTVIRNGDHFIVRSLLVKAHPGI